MIPDIFKTTTTNLLYNIQYITKPQTQIKKVIFNNPATIVFWSDGTKTVVKIQKGEVFDHEKGLAMAISKKMFGNCGGYYEVFKKYLPKETAFDLTNYMTPPEEGKDEKNN